eukprot:PhM_4_TR16576/c0_g1_i1/m.106039
MSKKGKVRRDADKIVPPKTVENKIRQHIKDTIVAYRERLDAQDTRVNIVNVNVLDYTVNGTQEYLKYLSETQRFGSPGQQLHLAGCADLVLNSPRARGYDGVVFIRFDARLDTAIAMRKRNNKNKKNNNKNDDSISLYLSPHLCWLGFGSSYPLRLGPRDIVSDHFDSGFFYNMASLGDRVWLGRPSAMLRLRNVFAYAVHNYVQGGGGVLNAAYLSEAGLVGHTLFLQALLIGFSVKCRDGTCSVTVKVRK